MVRAQFTVHFFPRYLYSSLAIIGLDKAALEKKIRLLTLTSLASTRVGKEITYEEIASALQIQEQGVESWIINGMVILLVSAVFTELLAFLFTTAIRAKLILGKMNQPLKNFVVIRANTREFSKENWEVLDKRLSAWKGAVLDVLQVVSAARRRSTNTNTSANQNTNAQNQNAIAA